MHMKEVAWHSQDWPKGCAPFFVKFQGENTVCPLLHRLWKLHCCSLVNLDQIFATAKIPGMSKDEQGGKNQIKVINQLSSPEPLKQLCPGYTGSVK